MKINLPITFNENPPWEGIPRIIGTEHELGTKYKFNNTLFERPLPNRTENGGRIYPDQGKVEMSTPETRNCWQLLAYEKAMERICFEGKYVQELYKHNSDPCNNVSWGAHINLSLRNSPRSLSLLIPFLITQQIISGAGGFDKDGKFVLSPRSLHIRDLFSSTTLDIGEYEKRAIICTREEGDENFKAYSRVHFIHHEGNMSHASIALKTGTLHLMNDLLEEDSLPLELRLYNDSKAVKDFHSLTYQTSDWRMEGFSGNITGLDLQKACLEACARRYSGRDVGTETLLTLWDDTINKLQKEPDSLTNRLDWKAKEMLFRMFEKSEGKVNPIWLMGQDQEYHHLNKERSLYYGLEEIEAMEKYVSESFIAHAIENPPDNTRAYIRGQVRRELNKRGIPDTTFESNWSLIEGFFIPDPFNSYKDKVDEVIRSLKK
ncbi:MAG: proteasome accessory factor PafA2 family protein [Nanoarchaeota archaeon]|nr:proteasome accessory factor PafA2 family protein [Nanoarchaeota archaeon]